MVPSERRREKKDSNEDQMMGFIVFICLQEHSVSVFETKKGS
jgi:hypothetical protein